MSDDQDGIVRRGETIGIGNEFTGVNVRKAWTKQGERLEIEMPRTQQRVLLDAMQLEILVVQRPERFTELFEQELGSQSDGELL